MHENDEPALRLERDDRRANTSETPATALKTQVHFFLIQKKRSGRPMEVSIIFIAGTGFMKIVLSLLFIFLTNFAFAAESTELICEMNREEYGKMSFDFRFPDSRHALADFQFQKTELSDKRKLTVTTVHQSSEARYVGLNFDEEKLVFIFITPIFAAENMGIPLDIEVVSSIYGTANIKCRATR
jgi:hypothetical protein